MKEVYIYRNYIKKKNKQTLMKKCIYSQYYYETLGSEKGNCKILNRKTQKKEIGVWNEALKKKI